MKNYGVCTLGIPLAAGILAASLSLTAWAGSNGGFHGAIPDKNHYGAIFQLDSGGTPAIKKTLKNIENLLHDPRLSGKLKVELIANSKGFDVYVKNNGFEQKLRDLQKEGVILAQCANTLKELHVNRSDLYPFINLVPSGMGEITIRESQGWAYIRPSAPESEQL